MLSRASNRLASAAQSRFPREFRPAPFLQELSSVRFMASDSGDKDSTTTATAIENDNTSTEQPMSRKEELLMKMKRQSALNKERQREAAKNRSKSAKPFQWASDPKYVPMDEEVREYDKHEGSVIRYQQGVVSVEGLSDVKVGQVLVFENGASGIVMNLNKERVECLLFSAPSTRTGKGEKAGKGGVAVGASCVVAGEFTFPVGKAVIGRVLGAQGEPLDGGEDIEMKVSTQMLMSLDNQHVKNHHNHLRDSYIDAWEKGITVPGFPLRFSSPSIVSRAPMTNMMLSGIKQLDLFHPIAKGIRVGLFGPKSVGKHELALSVIAYQTEINKMLASIVGSDDDDDDSDSTSSNDHSGGGNVNSIDKNKLHCVYVSVGKSKAHLDQVIHKLHECGAMESTTIVHAGAEDATSLQYLAPFSACAIANHFRDLGMHTLVIYDDLQAHGQVCSKLNRVLDMDDSLYLQARLLENAAQLSKSKGGGSTTMIALAETHGAQLEDHQDTRVIENIIGYVDHVITLDPQLAMQHVWPPISTESAVISPPPRYQPAVTRHVARELRALLSDSVIQERHHRMAGEYGLESTDIDESLDAVTEYKNRLQSLLSQPPPFHADTSTSASTATSTTMGMPLYLQLITAYAGVQQQTLLQGLDLDEFREFESKLHEFFQEELPHVVEALQDVCDQHLLSQVHLGDDNDNDMENDNDNDNDSDDNNDSDSERDRDSDRNNTDGDALSNDDVLALSIGLPRILQSEMYRGCNNFYQVYLYGDDA